MLLQSYLGKQSYISESAQNLCTANPLHILQSSAVIGEINNEIGKHHWHGLMCREICKQATGFVFCYTNTSVSFYQG